MHVTSGNSHRGSEVNDMPIAWHKGYVKRLFHSLLRIGNWSYFCGPRIVYIFYPSGFVLLKVAIFCAKVFENVFFFQMIRVIIGSVNGLSRRLESSLNQLMACRLFGLKPFTVINQCWITLLKIFKGAMRIFLGCVRRVHVIIFANVLKQSCREFYQIILTQNFTKNNWINPLGYLNWTFWTLSLCYAMGPLEKK